MPFRVVVKMAGCVWRAMRHAGIVGAATGSLNRISNRMLAVHGAGSLQAGAWRALSSASVTRVAAGAQTWTQTGCVGIAQSRGCGQQKPGTRTLENPKKGFLEQKRKAHGHGHPVWRTKLLFFVEGRWDGTRIQETLVVMSPPLYPADRSLLPLYSPVTAPSTDSEWSSVPGPLDPGAPAASAYVNKVEATHKGGGYFKPDLVLQYHSSEHYNAFELGRLKLKQVRESFAAHAQDCGGSEVQIAALSEKVRYMTVHLQTHHKDHASRRGLLSMLERRKKLLMYLRRTNGDSYGEVIYRLGLKDKSPSEDRYLQHEPKKNAAKKKKAKN